MDMDDLLKDVCSFIDSEEKIYVRTNEQEDFNVLRQINDDADTEIFTRVIPGS